MSAPPPRDKENRRGGIAAADGSALTCGTKHMEHEEPLRQRQMANGSASLLEQIVCDSKASSDNNVDYKSNSRVKAEKTKRRKCLHTGCCHSSIDTALVHFWLATSTTTPPEGASNN
jgi:hypothetical protein